VNLGGPGREPAKSIKLGKCDGRRLRLGEKCVQMRSYDHGDEQ